MEVTLINIIILAVLIFHTIFQIYHIKKSKWTIIPIISIILVIGVGIGSLYAINVSEYEDIKATRITGLHLKNNKYYITVAYHERMYPVDDIEKYHIGDFVDITFDENNVRKIILLDEEE